MSTRWVRIALVLPWLVFAFLGALDFAGLVEPPTVDPETGHPTVPVASSWGLLALLMLIIGGGFYVARRTPET